MREIDLKKFNIWKMAYTDKRRGTEVKENEKDTTLTH
jgi:hypothetical protein